MSTLDEARTEMTNPELQRRSDTEFLYFNLYNAFRYNWEDPTTTESVVWQVEEIKPTTPWTAPHWVKFLGERKQFFAKVSRATASVSDIVSGTESTASQIIDSEFINHAVRRLCREASDYQFEDGMISPFEIELRKLILGHGDRALEALHDFIRREINNVVAAEALRIIGDIKDPTTHQYRTLLLVQNLGHESTYMRDGAIVGLLYLDDQATLPPVETAIEAETSSILKEDLQQLADQLKATQDVTSQERQ